MNMVSEILSKEDFNADNVFSLAVLFPTITKLSSLGFEREDPQYLLVLEFDVSNISSNNGMNKSVSFSILKVSFSSSRASIYASSKSTNTLSWDFLESIDDLSFLL